MSTTEEVRGTEGIMRSREVRFLAGEKHVPIKIFPQL